MSAWDDINAFVRGTRPRPPTGPPQPFAASVLVTAAVLHMPLVYLLVRDGAIAPIVLSVGLLSMGLAWGGGVSLEGRRFGTTRLLCVAGIAESALAFVPSIATALGSARWLFVAIGVFAAAGLAMAKTPT